MDIKLTCTYCDHETVKQVYSIHDLDNETCNKCGDRNLVIKDLAKTKIDTYRGSPPFVEKKDEEIVTIDSGWPWNMGGD